ncbi:barstar family protein [Paenibacillus sp. TH7-28]
MIANNLNVTLGQPHFYIKIGDQSDFTNLLWDCIKVNNNIKLIAKLVRGTKCNTVEKLFDEFSAVLQFPWYFGENWDAFEECINDLGWFNADAYVIFISNSESLLELTNKNLDTFLNILKTTTYEWEKGRDFGAMKTSPTPFNIVFHGTGSKEQEIIVRFREVGINLERL